MAKGTFMDHLHTLEILAEYLLRGGPQHAEARDTVRPVVFGKRRDGNRECECDGSTLAAVPPTLALVFGGRCTFGDARKADPAWWAAYRDSAPVAALRAFAARNPTFCPLVSERYGAAPAGDDDHGTLASLSTLMRQADQTLTELRRLQAEKAELEARIARLSR